MIGRLGEDVVTLFEFWDVDKVVFVDEDKDLDVEIFVELLLFDEFFKLDWDEIEEPVLDDEDLLDI